jgi:hypothetical protein
MTSVGVLLGETKAGSAARLVACAEAAIAVAQLYCRVPSPVFDGFTFNSVTRAAFFGYMIFVYWVLCGKLREGEGYH